MCNQHSPSQSEEMRAKSLLSVEGNQLKITVTGGERSLVSVPDPESSLGESSFANDVATWVKQKEMKTDSLLKSTDIKTSSLEGNQLKITVTAGERSLVSLPDPESSLDESSFANDVASWVSQKEANTDSLRKSADIKKADWNLSVTKALPSKAYMSDLSADFFEELTFEQIGSDFDDEFEDLSENSPTKDTLCESLLQNMASSGSVSSEEAVSPSKKCGIQISDSLDTLVRSGWFPIPSRKVSAVIPAKTSVAALPSESTTKRKVPPLMQDPPDSQSSRFTTEELPAKRVTNTLPAVTNRYAGTSKAPQSERVEDVFQTIRVSFHYFL